MPLGTVGSGADNRAARHFQEGIVHYSELLILEKPPEMCAPLATRHRPRPGPFARMPRSPPPPLPALTCLDILVHYRSKRKRKKEDDGDAASATPHYRLMFSLYRRDLNSPPPPVAGEEATADGKHLTFCMAPEDILIRNSFHMLSEPEKQARRDEYKQKQVVPKGRGGGGGNNNNHGAAGSGSGGSGSGDVVQFDAAAAAAAATAVGMAVAAHGGSDGILLSPSAVPLPQCSNTPTFAPPPGGWVPALSIQALKSHATESTEHERIVKLEGISPGMTGGAMALLPDAPLLTVLSCKTGAHTGGTSVWIQGSRFNARTRVYVGGSLASRLTVVSDVLVTIITPPAQPYVPRALEPPALTIMMAVWAACVLEI